jgi:LytS/YehU family sensor histidine kinase
MRYIYGRDRQDLVPLKEELGYIDNYLQLQKLRFGNEIHVEYDVAGNATGKMIAPMILVPLVENAFKHGINAEALSEIKISILITDSQIHMHVFNHKVPVENRFESASGIGIANTRNRLALQYPGNHRLQVADEPEQFTADLTIQWIS